MKHFILVYDRPKGEIRDLQEFAEGQADEAQERLFDLELQERLEPQIEVVMISAPSREALEQTHSQYFFMQKPDSWLAGRVPAAPMSGD